jgi:hypothetical protein
MTEPRDRIDRAEEMQRRRKKLQEKHCKALTAGDLETLARVQDEVTRLVEQRDRLDHRREAARLRGKAASVATSCVNAELLDEALKHERLAQLAEEPTAS